MSPLASMKPCPTKGCAALTRGGCCEAHRHDRQRAYDTTRASSNARGYTTAWRKVRQTILTAPPTRFRDPYGVIRGHGPLCVMCLLEERVTPAREVDHIDGNSAHNHPDNLRSLCKACHSRRTATDQGFARGRADRGRGEGA